MKANVSKNRGTAIQMNLEPLKRMALSMLHPTTVLLALYGEKGWLPYRMSNGSAFAQVMSITSVADGLAADHGDIIEYGHLHSLPYYHGKMAEITAKYGTLEDILVMWDMRKDAYTPEFGEISPKMPEMVYYAPENYFDKLFFITAVIWDAYENGALTVETWQTLYVLSFVEFAVKLFDGANDYSSNANSTMAEESLILLHHAQHLVNSFYEDFKNTNNNVNDVIAGICQAFPDGWPEEFRTFDATAGGSATPTPTDNLAAYGTADMMKSNNGTICNIPNIMDL